MPPSGQTNAVLRPSRARHRIPICRVWTRGEQRAVSMVIKYWPYTKILSYCQHILSYLLGFWVSVFLSGCEKPLSHCVSMCSSSASIPADKLDFHTKQTQILAVMFLCRFNVSIAHISFYSTHFVSYIAALWYQKPLDFMHILFLMRALVPLTLFQSAVTVAEKKIAQGKKEEQIIKTLNTERYFCCIFF